MLIGSLGPQESYTIAHIRIFAPAAPGQPYPVELSLPGWRDHGRALLTLDLPALLQELDPRAYGELLGKSLFAEDVLGKTYRETLAAVRGRGDGLHVRLQCDPPELHGLHWERMLQQLDDQWLPLGSTAVTPFSRYIPARQWNRPLPVTQRPLRILALIARPADLDSYGLDAIADQEVAALHTLLDNLAETQVTYLESNTAYPPTLTNLRDRLAAEYHLVHVLCHGARLSTGTVLYLENAAGMVEAVEQAPLIEAFKVCRQPPLFCFLAACESAGRARNDAFVPLGPALVEEGGLQAVIAMSERVGQQTARRFAGQFYERLLAHGLVDLAANQARALVQEAWDWGAPVLFSRLPDNRLIDFPMSERYNAYFIPADRAIMAAERARETVRRASHGQVLVAGLEEVISELGKSHAVVVKLASDFRRLGDDPTSFAANFKAYYPAFKEYYDNQAWDGESTSCSKINLLRVSIMPALSNLLDPHALQELDAELGMMSHGDGVLLSFLQEFVESLNETVDAIQGLLRAGRIDEAIARKVDFEAGISPSFQRSKEMRQRMSAHAEQIAAC